MNFNEDARGDEGGAQSSEEFESRKNQSGDVDADIGSCSEVMSGGTRHHLE